MLIEGLLPGDPRRLRSESTTARTLELEGRTVVSGDAGTPPSGR